MITNVIDPTTEEVLLEDCNLVTTSGLTTLLADGLSPGENVIVYRLGPSGNYAAATNKSGTIYLSALPNTLLVEGGITYRFYKPETQYNVSVGFDGDATLVEHDPFIHSLDFSTDKNSFYIGLL